jgi:predicted RNase H-like HicB family nuclease
MKLSVTLEWDNGSQSFSATCPELNFIASCGKTKEQAIDNFKDAVQLMLTPGYDAQGEGTEIVEIEI